MTVAVAPVVEPDPRQPVARLGRLLDPGSAAPLWPEDGSGVLAVRGRIDGWPAVAFCTDATVMGGALGLAGARHIVAAVEEATRLRCPVIGLWHSGGARLADGVESMHGAGLVFAAFTRASGRVPQISVVLGPAAGAAAYGPALTDVIVMTGAGRVFVTGPDVVRSVTGEQISMEDLGGADAHGRRSGVAHVVAADEDDAYLRARRLAGLLRPSGRFDLAGLAYEPARDPGALLPETARRAYDIRPVIRAILDRDGDTAAFEEVQARWAPNIVVGYGRLAGHPVGIVANNPLRKGGCLDSLSAEKAARFVRTCDALGVPLVVLVDVPGYLPGVAQEWGGVVRRGAKLLHAFAEARVPRITVVVRKAYGGAYIAMNSRSLGATAVFAWPDAEIAVMGADAAVGVLHRKRLAAASEEERPALRAALVREHERVAGGVRRALALGVVDEVIPPAATRRRVAEALAAAPATRGSHANIPL
ncbi:acetyl-CoA/propionyl-CoA carboxylase carboxyl transferase subunit [Thermocatellispora tengchongensis]|uniref:Acetyl-CoA/propionyl-CoA carboxylase carboxyl transferase subunit n=1 Tax=Thermocatellispora tengchongensis TaxID=1073253 RepID=A0A840PNX2_9ACTN|nr:carboxyl transferase domain-containing protein [Thermocatellispora tengchongensis]MBB5140566.1 acetyl-CoA/propionyl-CoA carboxylase carboxyl transferase subunit [Thermocatellispora tengchongensis]